MGMRYEINSFQPLFNLTAPDFTALHKRVKALPELAADARLPEDVTIAR